jgi:sulfite reductase beta subunit-like hemoprotein
LAQLVDIILQEGGEELRLTPWRALLVVTPSVESAVRVVEAARLLGLIVHPDDARLAIAACPGAPECPQARGATRDHLERLAPIARLLSPDAIGLHVSGCVKGCAKPSPSPVTLIACGERFDLVYDGCADGTAAATGLSLAEVERLLAAGANKEASCPAQ